MKNNKGITIVALVIMIIIMIILAGIVITRSMKTIDESQKAVFQSDFRDAVTALNTYTTNAVIRGNNKEFDIKYMQWTGDENEEVYGSARIRTPDEEDTIFDILKDRYTKTLRGKIEIINGILVVKDEFPTEKDWVKDFIQGTDEDIQIRKYGPDIVL